MPTVTVATPAIPPRLNVTLPDAIRSVMGQTRLPDAHVIAIDNGAEGEAPTRNAALAQVSSEWVAFLDDDDWLYPTYLERVLAHQADSGADLVYPWFDVADGTDPFPIREGRPFDPDALRQNNYIPVTYLVRTSLAHDVGGYPLPFSETWPHATCVDWGFLLRVLDAGAVISHLPERLWCWRHAARDSGHHNTSGHLWPEVYGP